MIRNWSVTLAAVFAWSQVSLGQNEISPLPTPYVPSATFTMDTPDGLGQPMMLMPVHGGMPADTIQLINFPSVLDDLQLVDSQRADLKQGLQESKEKYHPQLVELTKRLSLGVRNDEVQEIYKQMSELQTAQSALIQQRIEEVLLPFQMRRLKEISTRSRLANEGSRFLQSKELVRELGLTDEQVKQLQQKQQEMEARLREDFSALQKKRQREMIEAVLSKPQQDKLDSILGAELSPSKTPPGTQPHSSKRDN